ncbi:MAG: DUF3050 domain-containing protein [Planctomycetota bacterium]
MNCLRETARDRGKTMVLAAGESINSLRSALVDHPLYAEMNTPERVVVFLEHHVWAVWDFMSLLKALQARLTCVSVPWVPPADTGASRLINSIVLGEESDDDGEAGHASHFDLYHRAMTQAGADTSPIDRFIASLRGGAGWRQALAEAHLPPFVTDFVELNLSIATGDDLPAIAAAFTLGREDLIPRMFPPLLRELAARHHGRFDRLAHYLERHVELDGADHGPAAGKLLASLCRTSGDAERAMAAAESCLRARLGLWDGILASFRPPLAGLPGP